MEKNQPSGDDWMLSPRDQNLATVVTGLRLAVLERALGALIVTHPDPAAFAAAFRSATAIAQVDHHLAAKAHAFHRTVAQTSAQELLELADAMAEKRAKGKGG